jgi:hypothetical protein
MGQRRDDYPLRLVETTKRGTEHLVVVAVVGSDEGVMKVEVGRTCRHLDLEGNMVAAVGVVRGTLVATKAEATCCRLRVQSTGMLFGAADLGHRSQHHRCGAAAALRTRTG